MTTYEVVLLEQAYQFLDSLDKKMRAKAYRSIELLKQFGHRLPMPHAKKLKGYELHELRIKHGTDIIRMFYFITGDTVCVITSGYVKKSNHTNRTEIERAIRLRDQFLEEER